MSKPVAVECVGGPAAGSLYAVPQGVRHLRVPVLRTPTATLSIEELSYAGTGPTFDVHFYVLLAVPGLQPLLIYEGRE